MKKPTELELAVLRAIGEQLPPADRAAFDRQTEEISALSRENTGAGFYTRFMRTPKAAKPIHYDTKCCHVTANIGGCDDALGFILWLKDGYVEQLEGYTLTLDTTIGLDLEHLKFELKTGPTARIWPSRE